MIIINNLEEMKHFYDENKNTYVFEDDVDFTFDFYFGVESNIEANGDIYALDISAMNIKACDIYARDITAYDILAEDIDALNILADNVEAKNIKACDIEAFNVIAGNIMADGSIVAEGVEAWDIHAANINVKNVSYFAVCYAENNIVCESIKGRHSNANHFVLEGKLVIGGVEQKNEVSSNMSKLAIEEILTVDDVNELILVVNNQIEEHADTLINLSVHEDETTRLDLEVYNNQNKENIKKLFDLKAKLLIVSEVLKTSS